MYYTVTLQTESGRDFEVEVFVVDGEILTQHYYIGKPDVYFDRSTVRLYTVKTGRALTKLQSQLTSGQWNSIMLQIKDTIAESGY